MVFGRTDPVAKAIADAEAARRSATAKREKRAQALEEARAEVARLREERDGAIRAEDPAGVKAATAAIADAEVSEEIAARAFQVAEEDERKAEGVFDRLTAEESERVRLATVAAKFKEAHETIALQVKAREEVIRCHGELNRLFSELNDAGAFDETQHVADYRLDAKRWGTFLHETSAARIPLEAGDPGSLTGPVVVRSRVFRYTLFGNTFRDTGAVFELDAFTLEQWEAIRANENLHVSRAAVVA